MNRSFPRTTIYALSSGHGKAGVAVVRVSGRRAAEAARALAGKLPEPRRAVLRSIRSPLTRRPLDRGLILWFPAPHSFTGEDIAEFHIHGGRAVIEAVLEALGSIDGLRPAEPGEFARRAFENGKLDLTAIEGLADLIDAETEAQRRQALRQSQGALAALYERWRSELIGALAHVEASLDFSDEGDVPEDACARARPTIHRLFGEISAHLNDGNRGEIVRDGLRIVIAGPPNAGKSSLLNALARRDVAIVSEEAGTTRDAIEVRLDLKGYPVIVTDTAGIRATAAKVEKEGIRRAMSRMQEADVVIWLTDATCSAQGSTPEAEVPRIGGTVIRVLNKIDLTGGTKPIAEKSVIPISAKTGDGLDKLVERLGTEAEARMKETGAPSISRPRHRLCLQETRDALERFLEGKTALLELQAEDLRCAAAALGRLTGRIDVEDVLDEIFAGFCIGK